MSGMTILSGNPSLEAALIELYGRAMPVRRVWSDQWRDPAEVAMDTCAADPELVVVGSDIGPEHARVIVPEIDSRFPSTTIVCLIHHPHLEYSVQLLRLGARDVLVENPSDPEFREQLDPIIGIAQTRHRQTAGVTESARRRRVITVASPKGGAGKTTVATNLAVGLSRQLPKQVVLLDLDVQFGDCAAAVGLRPEYSLLDAVKTLDHERSTLKVFLANHDSTLSVLSPPDDLAAAEEIDADDLKGTIAAFAEEFPFVIIDTAAGIDAHAVAAMEQATDLLLVTTPDVPTIRALRRELDALDRVGYISQRRILVVNRANAKVGLSVNEIEMALGLEATFQIPSTRLIPVSVNEGTAVIDRDSGGNVARRFDDMVRYFAPEQDGGSRGLLRALRRDH